VNERTVIAGAGLAFALLISACAEGGSETGQMDNAQIAVPAPGGVQPSQGTTAGAGAGVPSDGSAGMAAPVLAEQPAQDGPGIFDAGSAPDRNAVGPGTICQRLAQIQCAGEAFCCDAPGRDVTTCQTTMEAGCRDELLADAIAQRPEAGFDAAHAQMAFTALEEAASRCDPAIAALGESLDGIRGMFKGTLGPGEGCTPSPLLDTTAAAAALTACTDAATQACLPSGLSWSCVPLSDEGGNCFTDVNCLPGLFCDNPDLSLAGAACLPRKAVGEACALPNECQSLYCVGGACVPADAQSAYCLAR
jgi:hypothetical protein